MSYWTYVTGVITVEPLGRTQPEKRYILETVLEHLPKVTGSERDMHINVIQNWGHNGSCSHNEFGEWLHGGSHETQDKYMIILEASLRDRMFDETLRELNKWLNRLAKRVYVEDILVKLRGYNYWCGEKKLIISDPEPYKQMEEGPSWWNGEPAWAEYLMWDRAPDSGYPLLLAHKYYDIPEIDAEIERRRKWEKGD